MPKDGYNVILDGDLVHADDLIDEGPALDGVRYVRVNERAVYNRNMGYLKESIAMRKKHETENPDLTAVV